MLDMHAELALAQTQKTELQARLERLISLSTYIKNANRAGNLETLFELTARTLESSFGVRTGLLLVWDAELDAFRAIRGMGCGETGLISGEGPWKAVLAGNVICETDVGRVAEWFPQGVPGPVCDVSGLLIEPIQYTDIHRTVLGAIVVLAVQAGPINDTEMLLSLEAITSHLALMMMALESLGLQRRFLMPHHIEGFKRELRQRIEEARTMNRPFSLVQISDREGYLFRENNLATRLEAHYDRIYPVAHHEVFLLANGDGSEARAALAELLGDQAVLIRLLRYGKEFSSFQEFFDVI